MTNALPQESLLGYLRRFAHRQAYPSIADFLGAWTVGRYGRPLIENLPNLAEKLELPVSELESGAPATDLGREDLSWRFHRMHCDPFCPDCLREHGYWKAPWRHSLVTACPEHAKQLLDHCPSCNELLTCNGGGHYHCRCGYDLRRAPAPPANNFELQVSGIIGGGSGSLASHRYGLEDAHDVVRVVWFFGTTERRRRTQKPGKTEVPRSIDESRQFLQVAGKVFQGWPASLDAIVLERLHSGDDGRTANDVLGKWYQGILRLPGHLGDQVRDEVYTCLRKFSNLRYLPRKPDTDSTWMSVKEVARALGITAETVVKAISDGRIDAVQSHGPNKGYQFTSIQRQDVERIAAERDNGMTLKAACLMTGCGRRQIETLITAGVIKSYAPGSEPLFAPGPIDRASVETLVQTVKSGRTETQSRCGPFITFRDISLRKMTTHSALVATLQGIGDGEIRPLDWDPDGKLADAIFIERDLRQSAIDSGGSIVMSAQEVADRTGWKAECVTHWCNLGFIRASRNRNRAWQIETQDLVRFQGNYIVISDLAASTLTTSTKLLRRLDDLGIQTVGAKSSGKAMRGHLLPVSKIGLLILNGSKE